MKVRVPTVTFDAPRSFPPRGLRHAARAFSLLEMLLTLVIVLILVSIMFSRSSKTFQRDQKEACRHQLETLSVSLQIYANDHEGGFPVQKDALTSEPALALLMPRYLSTTQPFVCPGTKRDSLAEGAALHREAISYAYYMGRRLDAPQLPLASDAQVDASEKIIGDKVFSPDGKGPGSNHHQFGGNVLFVDGHAQELGTNTSIALPLGPGVRLLNPKQ
ncbi:MAG: prepilin-type N-terminal cleavage/methylation domain-containing protein [Verrucomicrobia bacterium]|nr:prepilin-type N-terminal cleavage/methylation domain-containing protein [Verrucomicrobiota bacterium]MBI3867850.1 prepilin-type N-terminal cleavage/methylation domain-containing protein [Verrucomicrobiota bacterium]